MKLAIIIFNHLSLLFNLSKKNDWQIIQFDPSNKKMKEGERVKERMRKVDDRLVFPFNSQWHFRNFLKVISFVSISTL